MSKYFCGLGYLRNFFKCYYIDSVFLDLVTLERDYTHQENIAYEQLAEFAKQL